MRTPEDKKKTVVIGPNFLSHWFVYDYERCDSIAELEKVIDDINRHGYDIVGLTQDIEGVYTVLFRRRACG